MRPCLFLNTTRGDPSSLPQTGLAQSGNRFPDTFTWADLDLLVNNDTVLVDDPVGTNHPHSFLAKDHLLAPGTPGIDNLVIGVGEQVKGQVFQFLPTFEGILRIWADSQDNSILFSNFGRFITEARSLLVSTRGVRLGESEQDNLLPTKVTQLDGFAVLVGGLKIGGWCSNIRHNGLLKRLSICTSCILPEINHPARTRYQLSLTAIRPVNLEIGGYLNA